MDKIWNLIDLRNIGRLQGTSGAIEVARNICEGVFPLINNAKDDQQQDQGDGEDSEEQDSETKEGERDGMGASSDQDDSNAQESSSNQGQPKPLSDKMKNRLDNLVKKEMDLLRSG